MNQRICYLLAVTFFCCSNSLFAQLIRVEPFLPKRLDSLRIERNWRTKDPIILAELEFGVGDTVTPENLTKSLKKIWNLQNFATVDYHWDSLPDGRSMLVLTTRDALTVRPIIAGHMDAVQDFTVKLGAADHNLLGRNIGLEVRAQASVHDPVMGEAKLTIPRQLLWKNMSIGGGFEFSEVFNERSKQFYIQVVNPFHEDFRNTFAPDIETGWLKHYSIPPSLSGHDSIPEWYRPYEFSYWYFRVSESIGLITHRRHQEEGYLITGMLGTDIGLDQVSENFIEASLDAEYDKIIRSKWQISAQWKVNYSSSDLFSFWSRLGPADIPGISYGDISGPLLSLLSAGCYYTWLDRDFLALEQSVFIQYATAMTAIGDWSSFHHQYAIGTGFRFTIPMFPAASILISFSLTPNRNHWFRLEL